MALASLTCCSGIALAQVRSPEPPAAIGKAAGRADGVSVQPTPGWVSDRTIPEATKARTERAQNGVAYLLTDAQYRTRADGHDDWSRTSTKIVNRSGLESAGQIEVSFNPAFESVGINFIHLIRAGKVIDLTNATQFRVVEREEEMNDGIISGTLKAVANLSDVRVGDIVDYATTMHTSTRLWPNQTFFHFSQRYSDAVALNAIRLVWPAGLVPQVKAINSDVAFTVRPDGSSTDWEWTAQDPQPFQAEDNVPATAFQWGRVDVSTMKQWSDLARWAATFYQGDDSLTDDFAQRLDAIAKASASPADQLTEAVRYVQDNIRYVGEELGEGSYVPRRPKTVLLRGYGDCKDKSLLLAVALRRLGIDAVPALVSTRAGERLPDRLPSPLLFDHVVVRAVLGGKVLWIDATGSHRGGRGAGLVPSDLGYALPIRVGQTALERMEGYGDHAGRYTVLEQFTVDEAADAPLTLHVETRYTEARADSMRATWASTSTAKVADGNLEFYHNRFPGLVASKPLELHDDRDANVLTMVENYTMPRAAFGSAKLSSSLITRAYAVQKVLPDRQANPRIQPLSLADHLVNEQTIELRVKDRDIGTIEDIDAARGPVDFSRRSTRLPDGLRTVYRLDTGSRDAVPATDAEAVYATSDRIKDEAGIEFHLDKAPKTAASPEGIDVAAWAPIKPQVEKIVALMQKEDEASLLSALSLLTDVSAKVPRPSPTAGLLDGLKGAVLGGLHRQQAALVALQSGTTQYDGNPAVFRLWIAYEIDLGTGETIARAMKRTRQAQPAVLAALDKQWTRIALQKAGALAPDKRLAARQDICIAFAEAGWQQAPRTSAGDAMLGCAIEAHSLRGEMVDARAGLAKSPPTDTLMTLAIDRRHQALWPDIDRLASDRFRKALEREAERAASAAKAAPTNYDVVTRQMQTLRALGQFDQALAAGKALAGATAQVEVGGSDAFWLVNEYAANLRASGRLDDAISALDKVLALGVDRYPELLSVAINRSEMLVAAGRHREAIDAVADFEAHHLDGLSPYGRMWLWASQTCALQAMGRNTDADGVNAKIVAKAADNWSAASAAAACRNDSKAIADMLVTRLRDDDARPTALGLFVQFEVPETHSPLEKSMREVMERARHMPTVQAEFAKYGRSMRYAGTAQGWSEF